MSILFLWWLFCNCRLIGVCSLIFFNKKLYLDIYFTFWGAVLSFFHLLYALYSIDHLLVFNYYMTFPFNSAMMNMKLDFWVSLISVLTELFNKKKWVICCFLVRGAGLMKGQLFQYLWNFCLYNLILEWYLLFYQSCFHKIEELVPI